MAIQTATNPETGERFALVDNQWTPLKTATNPDTGEQFGLINNEWVTIGKVAPKAPKASQAAASTPTPGVTDPMGMGGSEIMDVAGPPAGGSIFERGIKMEPPTVDAQKNLEAMQRSGSPESVMFTPGRGLQQAQQIIEKGQAQQEQLRAMRERVQQFDAEKLQREKEAQGYYGPVDLAKDVGLAGAKGVVGLGQMGIGLANILTGWYPDNPLGVGQWGKMMDKLGYNPEQTNRFFTGLQTPIAQTQQQEVESAEGFIATLKSLAINPVALTTMVVESVPGTVSAGAAGGQLTKMLMLQATKEAAEQGLKGYAASKFIANKVKDQIPQIAAAAAASEGVQTAGSIAEQARERGQDWDQYVAPAVAAGLGTAAIGMVSGKVGRKLGIGDIETDIAARMAGVKGGVGVSKDPFAKAIFKEMAKEGLLEELPQGVQEQLFTNLATGQPWDKDLGKAGAQSLAAGVAMGGGHAAFTKALDRTGEIIKEQVERNAPDMTAEELARSKGFLVPTATAERPEPTLDLEALLRGEMPKRVQEEEAEEIKAITEDLISQNIPKDNAHRIAVKRVADARKERIADLIAEPSDDPVRVRAKEHIDAGMDPVEAINRARVEVKEEDIADALAATTTKGAPDVRETIPEAGGVSPTVAGQPGEVSAAPGAGGVEPTGVVPAGPDVTGAPQGAGVEPAAVTGEQIAPSPAEATIPTAPTAEVETQAPAGIPEDVEAQQAAEQTVAAVEQEVAAQEPKKTKKSNAGRTPAKLTDDERAQKEKATRAYKARYSQGERDYAAANKALFLAAQPIDEEKIADEEALKEAQAEKRAHLVSAIRGLLSVEKTHRGTPLGSRAKALLADRTKISEKDFNDIKKGWEATQHSKSLASSRVKANPMLKGKMSAAKALDAIIKNGTPFEAFLAKRIRKYLSGVVVHVVEAGDPTPARLKLAENFDAWDRARGVYMAADETGPREVYLRGASFGFHNGVNNVTALHELLHAALNHRVSSGLLGGVAGKDHAQLVKLTRELSALMENASARYSQMERRGVLPPALQDLVESTLDIDPETGQAGYEIFELPHEFLAYGLSDPVFQKFLMGIEGRRTEESGFSRFVKAILQFLGLAPGQFTALSDLINVTDDMLGAHTADLVLPVQQRVSKAAKQKQPPVPKASVIPEDEDKYGNPLRSAREQAESSEAALNAVEASREGDLFRASMGAYTARGENETISALKGIVERGWINMSDFAIKRLTAAPSMQFLSRWSGIKALDDLARAMQEMGGMANALVAQGYHLRKEIQKDFAPFFKSDKKFQDAVIDLIYGSTIDRYDPSDPKIKVRSKEMDALWKRVGVKGQRIYLRLKQHYENMIDLYSDLLGQQIEAMQGVTEEVKQNLMLTFRSTFEVAKRIRPYFPLVRFGDYWLRVQHGDYPLYYMFEDKGSRDQFRNQLAFDMKEDPNDAKYFEVGEGQGELRKRIEGSSAMLTQMMEAIESQDFGKDKEGNDDPSGRAAKDALKDAVYQIYISTMPEQNVRNMFIHRKDRAGFSTDLLRNISATSVRTSMQIARLKYAPIMRNAVSGTYSAVRGRDNMLPFAKEAERRANAALQGTRRGVLDAIVGAGNWLSYLWYMTGQATAFLQPVSLYFNSLPVLWGNYGSLDKATYELGRAIAMIPNYGMRRKNRDGSYSWVAPSLANNTTLPEHERDAIHQMTMRGVNQNTYASAMTGYASTPSHTGETWIGKGVDLGKDAAQLMTGALLHNTERLTKEATYLAAYRLGYAKYTKEGMTHEQAHEAAVNKAVDSTNESLGNYDMSARPLWMQNALGRLIMQFRTWQVHTLLLQVTTFKEMIPFLNKEGKIAAAKKFFGMAMAQASLAGVYNTLALQPILGVLAWAFAKAKDDDDIDKEFSEADPNAWFRYKFLPEKLGKVMIGKYPLNELLESPIDSFTGLSIGDRIGSVDIFGRDLKEAKDGREFIHLLFDEYMGPTVSLGLSAADAYHAWKVGDFDKIEEKTPAFYKNQALGARIEREGVKLGDRVIIPADKAYYYAVAQRIGFRPSEIARAKDLKFALTKEQQAILIKRNELVESMKVQARKDTEESLTKLREIYQTKVIPFNERHPQQGYRLSWPDVVDILAADRKARGSETAGIRIDKRNAMLAQEAADLMEERIQRMQKRAGVQ